MKLATKPGRTRPLQPWIPAVLAALMLVTFGDSVAVPQVSPATQSAPADSPDAHLGRAYDALRDDRYEVAAAEFRAALKLDPKLTLRARFPLAVALFEMKKPDEARREFEAVRHEAGDHPNISYYLGRLDLDELHYESAIRNLKQAIAHPPFPDTAYYLGFAYFKQGDLAGAGKRGERGSPRQHTPRHAPPISARPRISQARAGGGGKAGDGAVGRTTPARFQPESVAPRMRAKTRSGSPR